MVLVEAVEEEEVEVAEGVDLVADQDMGEDLEQEVVLALEGVLVEELVGVAVEVEEEEEAVA